MSLEPATRDMSVRGEQHTEVQPLKELEEVTQPTRVPLEEVG